MAKDFYKKRAIMKELRDNGEFLNCTILTEDGGSFKVHIEFLVGMSPYLRRIVISATDVPFESILIPGISRKVMENIINFVYTGQLTFSMDTVTEIAKAAEILVMPFVTKMCRKYLISHLNAQNCLAAYTSPDYSVIPGIRDDIKPYVLRHFQEIFPVSSDYLKLDFNDLLSILSSDDLNVTGEEYVFWAIMRWVEHDCETRRSCLSNLLRCIRLGLCNPKFYEQNIQNHPFITGNHECLPILLQTEMLFSEMSTSPGEYRSNVLLDMRHPFLRPRTPTEVIFVMGGWSAGSATNVIETYDIKSGRWFLSTTADSIPRAYHGMLWHKGYIYVIGGFDGNQCFNDVRRFDPVSHVWEAKGCMYTKRCYISVAAVDDYIYAMGGFDGHRRNKTCERYDTEHNQWKMMASMNQIRSDASADSLGGKIYIAGGFNGQQVLNSAECYDPETDVWTPISNLTSPRSGVKLAAYNGFLFLIGGFDGNQRLQTVEKYDPRTQLWTSVPNLNGPRSNFAIAVLYDCIYVMGGFNGLTTIPLAECYDHRKNVWTLITELNLNRSALAACTVKDIPNASEYTFLGNASYLGSTSF